MSVGSWYAGEKITAAKLNLITPTWSSWTPTWTTSSGSHTPSIGNGTYACSYTQTGDLIIALFDVTFGSSTSFNSGTGADNFQFSLPVTAATSSNAVGMAELTNTGSARAVARIRLLSTTVFGFELSSGRPDATTIASANTGLVDAVSPWTWGNGMGIRGTLTYRAA